MASYFDIKLSYDTDGHMNTSLYDKHDDLNFSITNFSFLSSNIPSSPVYGVFISQLIRYVRASTKYRHFFLRARRLSYKLLSQNAKCAMLEGHTYVDNMNAGVEKQNKEKSVGIVTIGVKGNIFFPQFDQPEYTAIVKPFARGVLRGISATDLDDSECAEKTSEFCSCSYVIYRVFENSNESAKFQMNHDTGDLHFDVFEEGTVELIIAAYNYDADNNPDITDFRVGYSKVILYITNETPIGIRPDLREMERVPNIYNWKSSVPGESVAVIRATDGWELRSNVSFTDSIVLSLTISLSRGIHYLDAFVMSDVTTNGSPLFHFCEAAMGEVGSNLHILGSGDVSLGRSTSNSYTNDIINISIVNVINDEADTSSSAANEVVITFTATVLNPTDVEYDTEPYYVSALVLDNSTEYLSVTNYTTNITAPEKYGTSSISTVFNGPSALNPGGRAMWDISWSVDAPVMNFTVDHGDSGNNSIEICDVQIILVDFKVDTSDDQVVVRVYGAIPSYAESGQNYTLSLLMNNGTHVSNEMKTIQIDSSPPQQSSRMGVFDEVSIEFGSLLNVDLHSDSNGNEIEFSLSLCYLECDTLNVGDSFDVIATLAYGALTVSDSISLIIENPVVTLNQFPEYNVSLNSAINSFRIGEAAIFDAIISLPLDFVSKLFLKAEAIDTEIEICRIYLSSRGSNIPCLADNDMYETKTAYPGDGYSSMQLDLHTVTQTGRFKDETANILHIRIAVALRNGFSYGSAKYLFQVQLWDEFIGTPWTETHGLYVDTNSAYETPAPEIAFSSSSTSIQVAKGSTEVVKIIVYSSTKSKSSYSLTVSVTTGCASICNLVFVSRGENNPCIQDVQPTQRVSADGNVTYSSATIDIGEIVNIGDIGSQTIQTSNEIIFEAAIYIPSSVPCGAVDLEATLSYNSDADTITNSISMDVVDEATLTSNDTIYLSSVPPYDTPVTAAIGEVLTWKVQMHLPEIIDKYQLSITFPVSENEAHLTIVNSSITYVGENIGCFSNDGIQTTYNSSLKSTQMTEMNMKFGEYLSNTGTYKMSQFRQPMLMDDVIEIEFMFQVTDHPANIEGSVQNFTVTVAHSDGRTTNITDGVTIIVVGDEQATLKFDAWAELFNFTDKNTGDIIKLFGEVELQTSSNAHASNVILHYILPQYSIMTTLVTFTDIEPNITVTSDGSLEVEYDLLRFTDNPTFEIAIAIDHRAEFEAGTTNIQTVIPTDVSYTSLQRPDRSDNILHYTDLKLLQFGFNALECDKVIGIETDPIDECQMSSSSEQGLYRAIDVQSGSLTGWSPSIRGPPFCGHEYVQLDFLAEMRIVGLSILSAGNDNLNYITNFTLEYSSNAVLWKTILDNITSQPKIFLSSFNDATKSLSDAIYIGLEANDIFVASKLRIYPKDSNNGLSCRPFLRFDAIGCRVQFDSNIGSCSTQASSTFPLREREYIVDDILGNIYACILSEIGGDIVCSRSVDNGSTWEDGIEGREGGGGGSVGGCAGGSVGRCASGSVGGCAGGSVGGCAAGSVGG
ncbi:hypothetical protein FSP39_000810 [Pinctada imbricata]|uniref:F5/8 type C domain-containing protein n=1 Tax=Pinctada imbricata TaxID=66713 RepID=A0AA88YG08_PINIB|nr:hypothetical protein FSP39_000810 [Pinctada imbricata]